MNIASLKKIEFYILAALLAALPAHGLITIVLRGGLGYSSYVVLWKEALLLLLLIISAVIYIASKKSFPFVKEDLVILALLVVSAASIRGDLALTVAAFKVHFLAIAAYLIVRTIALPAEKVRSLVKVVIAEGSVAALIALMEFLFIPSGFFKSIGYGNVENVSDLSYLGDTSIVRARGTFPGPNQLGTYLIIPFWLAVYFRREKYMRLASWMMGAAIIVTFSRSVWLALFAGAAMLAFEHRAFFKKYFWHAVLPSVALLLTLLLTGMFSSVLLHDESTIEHADATEHAWSLFLESPLGYGLGSAGPACQQIETSSCVIPENYYLQILLEIGILGLIVYLLFMSSWFKRIYASKFGNDLKTPLRLSLLGVLVVALFLHTNTDSSVQITLGSLIGALTGKESKGYWNH